MPHVSVPSGELTHFDLPKICVITGGREGVSFREVKFSWYPRGLAILFLMPILAVIVIRLMTRTTKGQLPFTDAGYSRYRRARLVMPLSLVLAVFLWAGALYVTRDAHLSDGASIAMFLLFLALPFGTYLAFVRGHTLKCTLINETKTTLEIPSEDAARAIHAHLVGGRAVPVAALA